MPKVIEEISLEQEAIGVSGGTTKIATQFGMVVIILFSGVVIFWIIPWMVGIWYIFNHVFH